MVFQIQSPSLRPQTTAHLAQTMTLLGLTAAELRQAIEAALSSNPALEVVEPPRCATCGRALTDGPPCPVCNMPSGTAIDEPVVFVSTRDDFSFPGEPPIEDYGEDNFTVAREDLALHVMRQIAPELDESDRPLAAHILTSLDEDGLLSVTVLEIAHYHHVSPSQVEKVLRQIQRADPIGVGSPSPQDALLVQLEVLSETCPVPPLTDQAIREGMKILSRHRYSELARLLGIPLREARRIAQFIIENLNPFPARAHWGGTRQIQEPGPPVYQNPDVIITLLDDNPEGPLVVEVMLPISGWLGVNRDFREALKNAPDGKREAWKSDLENASLLVKCLRQRNHTMVRMMQYLAVRQRRFILEGNLYLHSMTRAQVSRHLDVHESTISRAVSDKTIQLPSGRIIPLAQFFDRSLPVRTALREIVDEESKPLSDSQIRTRLAEKGYRVARRTVAKYRAMEGILPAHLRHHHPTPMGQ